MKIGIIGLPQTGKKTLFELLTGVKLISQDSDQKKSFEGIADILDPRFDALVSLYKPKKATRARLAVRLFPKIDATNIREGEIFKDIADMDALCHVVRGFLDDTIYHVDGSVNPARDIDMVNSELILHDLIFIEKRLERIGKGSKKAREEIAKKEEDLLLRFKNQLENGRPLRLAEVSDEEAKIISSYPFLTAKKMIVALNVSDSRIADKNFIEEIKLKYDALGMVIMQLSAKLESEISLLDSADERKEFMQAAGIEEPAINLLSRLCMSAVGLISFFTVGEDEVRQWLVRSGSLAPEAGGTIHTDIQRGFIRAEVIKYDDLINFKSEDAVKKAGKLNVMGKDYQVMDGDIISFRFNV